jgi:hypothetical protein
VGRRKEQRQDEVLCTEKTANTGQKDQDPGAFGPGAHAKAFVAARMNTRQACSGSHRKRILMAPNEAVRLQVGPQTVTGGTKIQWHETDLVANR